MVVLTDDEYREWQETDLLLRTLTSYPEWQALVAFSHERMAATKKAVLNGHYDDIDKYKNQTGWLRGIHDVLDTADTVRKVVEDERVRRAERERVE